MQFSTSALGACFRDVVGLEAHRIEIDEVAQVVAEGDECPREGTGDEVFVAEADFEAGVALRAQRQVVVRAVGEVVRRRRAIGRTDFGVGQ